jgi:molecular chaperone DnaK (HSP70)
MDEPTAAALVYGLDTKGATDEKNFLVFDLGGWAIIKSTFKPHVAQ